MLAYVGKTKTNSAKKEIPGLFPTRGNIFADCILLFPT